MMSAKAHDTIGVSPLELLLGKAINLCTGALSPISLEPLVKGKEEAASGRLYNHVAKLINNDQHLFIDIARDSQLSTDSFYMKEASPSSHMHPVN
jgi:hypothetical protein